MYTLINEDLFSFRFTQDSGQQSNFPHQMEICSANELVRYPKEEEQEPSTNGQVVVNMQKTTPIYRKILSVFSVDDDFTNHPMSYRAQWNVFNERPNPFVSIRCHDRGDDHANLFIIAFPFNGRLKPIPPSNQYRILKGTIVSSVKNFWYRNTKYRKVLYLIIEPNADHIDPENPAVVLEGFGIYHDLHNDGAEMTKHETLKITFTDACGNYSAESEHEIIDHAVQLESYTGEELWKTAKIDPPQKKPQGNGYNNNRNTSGYHEAPQGVRVTKNKNGIRKEVPIGGRRDNHRSPKDNKDDLDSMIKKANLVDDYEYRSGKKGRGKKNTRR